MGANVLVKFEKKILIGGIFFKLGANVLVEFEKKILIKGISFSNWGQWGQMF